MCGCVPGEPCPYGHNEEHKERVLGKNRRIVCFGLCGMRSLQLFVSLADPAGTVYNIKAKELNKHIKIRRASKSNKEARIIATGRPIKLYLFTTAASRKNPKSKVKVKIKKGRGTRPLTHSFIARMESGHINVWIREGAKRIMTRGRSKGRKLQPIKGQYTVSVAQMYEKESDKTFKDLIARDIDKTFDANFKFYTKKLR